MSHPVSMPTLSRPRAATGLSCRGSLRLLGLPGLLAAAICAALPAEAQRVVDMGELSPGLGSVANAINNAGRTVGRAMSATDFQYRQVIWQGLALSEFDHCCSGFLPTLRSINLGGEVVGDHFATRDDSLPVYWSATGVSAYLPGLSANGFGYANSINHAGYIAGASLDDNFDTHAVVWLRTGAPYDMGFLGEPSAGFRRYAEAKGINNKGLVVGTGLVGSQNNAFSWKGGRYTNLGPGAATHVNDAGLIAGYAPGFIPVVWRKGVRSNLPGLDGGSIAYGHLVNGINQAGDLVGYGPGTGPGLTNMAVLWRGGRAIALGNYPGGTTSVATGINDLGQVVGYGNLVPGGAMHALRWSLKGMTATVTAEP